jgi:hypothetical protein
MAADFPTTPLPQPRGADRQGTPRFQLEESFSGFLYKKTDSDAHPEPSVVETLLESQPTAS